MRQLGQHVPGGAILSQLLRPLDGGCLIRRRHEATFPLDTKLEARRVHGPVSGLERRRVGRMHPTRRRRRAQRSVDVLEDRLERGHLSAKVVDSLIECRVRGRQPAW